MWYIQYDLERDQIEILTNTWAKLKLKKYGNQIEDVQA